MSYVKVALKAVEIIKRDKKNPVEAWEEAAKKVFPIGSTSIVKCCPKNAFLGLCEEGLIENVEAGSYTKSLLNKQYATKAVELLKAEKGSLEPKKLWL